MDLRSAFARIESQFAASANPRSRSAAPRSAAMLAKVYCGETPASFSCEPKVDGVRVIATADLDNRRADVIGQTAEVAFHCVTPDDSLRHPSLVRIRGDK